MPFILKPSGSTNITPPSTTPMSVEAVADTLALRTSEGALKASIDFQPNSNPNRPVPFILAKRTGVCYWDGSIAGNFESGDGSKENPYIIASAEQFAKAVSLSSESYTYFKISDNLATIYLQPESLGLQNYRTLNAKEFFNDNTKCTGTPLSWDRVVPSNTRFHGSFDGNGCEIVGAYSKNTSISNHSLFGMPAADQIVIRNVIVSQCYFVTGYRGAVLINADGTTWMCKNVCLQDNYIEANIDVQDTPNPHIGIFAGHSIEPVIKNCYTTNNVIYYNVGDRTVTTVIGEAKRGAKLESCFFDDATRIDSTYNYEHIIKDSYSTHNTYGLITTTSQIPKPSVHSLLDWGASWLPVNGSRYEDIVVPFSFLSNLSDSITSNISNLSDSLTSNITSNVTNLSNNIVKLNSNLSDKTVKYNYAARLNLQRGKCYLLVNNASSNGIDFWTDDSLTTPLSTLSKNGCRSAFVIIANNGCGYILQLFKLEGFSLNTLADSFSGNQFNLDDEANSQLIAHADTVMSIYEIL